MVELRKYVRSSCARRHKSAAEISDLLFVDMISPAHNDVVLGLIGVDGALRDQCLTAEITQSVFVAKPLRCDEI